MKTKTIKTRTTMRLDSDDADRLENMIEELAFSGCDCDLPGPGEDGIIQCLACRAAELVAAFRKARPSWTTEVIR